MTTHEVFQEYFQIALLKETLEKAGVMDKPAQIYSCDESGMPLEHKAQRKFGSVTQVTKTQITILGAASAAGQLGHTTNGCVLWQEFQSRIE